MKLLELFGEVHLFPLGIYLPLFDALVISDLHIGYEQEMNRRGILLPFSQYPAIEEELMKYFSIRKIDKIIIAGDLKDNYFELSFQEREELSRFVRFLDRRNVQFIFIRGNHDTASEKFLLKLGVEVHLRYFILGNIFITHGHIQFSRSSFGSDISYIIYGHEHPSLTLENPFRRTSFKAIFEGKLYGKICLILPPFNFREIPLGDNFQNRLSPLSKSISPSSLKVHVFEDRWYSFPLAKIPPDFIPRIQR